MSSSDSSDPHETTSTHALLLGGVDRAAFAVAFADRLRSAGVDVGLPAASTFARALAAQPASTRSALYWLARVTLTHRHSDVEHRGKYAVEYFDVTVPMGESDPCQPVQRRAGGRRLCGKSACEGARGGQPDIDAGRPQAIGECNRERGTVHTAQQKSVS